MPTPKKRPREIPATSIEDVIRDFLVRDGESFDSGERACTEAERDESERVGHIFEDTATALEDALDSGRRSDVTKVLKRLRASLKGLAPTDIEVISATRLCIDELEGLLG